MNLIKRLFKDRTKRENGKMVDWIQMTEESVLENLIDKSLSKPIIIFKHSTRCGVSRMALNIFENSYEKNEITADFYFLDLLKYRKLSNEISDKLKIRHQSPQVIAVKNREVVYHDSHYSINLNSITKALE